MPAIAKVTKEMIIDAAFEIAKEMGAENINARTVSQKPGCSTQPVLYHFKTIEDVRTAAHKKASEFHINYVTNLSGKYERTMLEVGMRHIQFAVEEKNLFCFLFHSNYYTGVSLVPLMIAVLMILYGISGIYQPAVQASIPLIAEKQFLMQGNAVINMVSTLAGLLGPIIGGVLFGAFGIMPILFISVGCFVFSAVMEIFIHIPFEKNTDGKSIWGAVGSDLSDSFQFIKNEKPIFLSVLGILALFNLILTAMMLVGIPVIVVQILGMSDTAIGITQGAMGLGGIAGGIIAGAAAEKIRPKSGYVFLMICSLAAFFMGISILEAILKNIGYFMITAISFGAMCASTMFGVSMMTVAQQQTPPHLLGKIMAVIIAVSSCSQPVGQAVYGVLFDIFADKPYLITTGAAILAMAVSLYSKKVFAVLEKES